MYFENDGLTKNRILAEVLTIVVSVLVVSQSVDNVMFNLANVFLTQAIWHDDQSAIERQQKLRMAAGFLDRSSEEVIEQTDRQCSMIPSLLIAHQFWKDREFEATVNWLGKAAEANPSPPVQKALVLPGWVSVSKTGNVVIDWTTFAWRFRGDSQSADLTFDDETDQLTISYKNTLGKRDRVCYQWSGPLKIPYWHKIRLRARVQKGTFLTIETHTAAGVERHVDYFRGDGEWKEFVIPLDMNEIRWIYISISEPSANSSTPDYAVDIEPLIFLLDEAVGGCE